MTSNKKAKSSDGEPKDLKNIPAEVASSVGDGLIFELPSVIDISLVAQICDNVKAAYNSENINFNASKVERITTPGIQLLIAATSTAKSRGGKVIVSAPSDAFQNIISDLGFSNQLKEWMGSDV